MAIQQTKKLDDLRSENEWLLIIFDALRYDTFDHFTGEADVQPTISPATWTNEWMEAIWPDNYDVCYVTGAPLTGSHDFSPYNGTDHFNQIVEVWKDNWDREVRTVRPKPITEAAMDALDNHDKVLVHYIQPHAPYIGEPKIIGQKGRGDTPTPDTAEEDTGILGEVRMKISTGEISLETLQRAYYDNLVQVVKGSKPLIKKADRRTVVTSDHGECLGEHKIGHNYNCAHVRMVPWYEPK